MVLVGNICHYEKITGLSVVALVRQVFVVAQSVIQCLEVSSVSVTILSVAIMLFVLGDGFESVVLDNDVP